MKYQACRQMLSTLSLLLLANFAVADNRATELVVAKNQTYRISTPQLQLKRLELQDGAVVTFAPGITRALIHADHAVIGNGVHIDASGADGATGAAGSGWKEAAAACDEGRAGGDGASGGAGGNGIDLIVELGVVRIGSLRIDAEGGVGGKGGNGGDGQRGGDIDRCYGKDGGDGGNGGNGGVGGNGGAVTLRYWLPQDLSPSSSKAQAALKATDLVNAFSISVRGGHGGAGGDGGAGGGVVPGRYLNTSVGTGKKWLGAGDAGKAGGAGRAGNAGAAGSVSLMQQAEDGPVTQSPLAPVNIGAAAKSTAAEADIGALRKQVEALQRRVEALEAER